MLNNQLTISIIAPIYGVEKFIARFADSVLSQSYPHIEYIFVNDGTRDKSIEVLETRIREKYEYRRTQIKIINKENEGLPAARMTGIEHATGDYVYHVDPDDWIEPNSIAKIAARIEETNADIVYFNYIKDYPDHSKSKREQTFDYNGNIYKDIHERYRYIHNMFNGRAIVYVWNKCIRRSLYTNNEIFFSPYGYAEDAYLITQLVGYSHTIAGLDEYVYHYQKGNNPLALTAQKRKNRKMEYCLNYIDLYERYCNIPADVHPLSMMCDEIALKVGWYSLIYRLGLFDKSSILASAVLKAHISRKSRVWVLAQLFTKMYAYLHLKL